jgi:hypothetical protein
MEKTSPLLGYETCGFLVPLYAIRPALVSEAARVEALIYPVGSYNIQINQTSGRARAVLGTWRPVFAGIEAPNSLVTLMYAACHCAQDSPPQ